MELGDLVRVHWGSCDWSGEKDVDWGHSFGIVAGKIRWWNDDVRNRFPCGDIDVLVHGEVTSYNMGRLDPADKVDDGSW